MQPITKNPRTPVRLDDSINETLPKPKPAKEKVFFPNLDGLRFFCFLSVFLSHSFYTNNTTIMADPVYKGISYGITNGGIGVNFFFVLSGFLITYLLLVEKQTFNKIHVGKFWMRRILRIWPLYFACVFFGFAIFPMIRELANSPGNSTGSLVHYLFFLSNLDVVQKQVWPDTQTLAVLWSVAIEEQFYLVWPLLMTIVKRKRLPFLFAGVIFTSWVYRVYYNGVFEHEHHTLSCMGDLAVGGCGAYLAQNQRFKEWISNWNSWSIATLYIVFAALYLFRDQLLNSIFVFSIFERSIISVVILLIILEQNYARNSLFKMSKYKTLSKLGTITYGMYCLHTVAILIVTNLTFRFELNIKVWHVLLLEPTMSFIITIILSTISYRYYESWFLRLKDRFSFITR